MSLANRLIHRLAIVTPTIPDPEDVDEEGNIVHGDPDVVAVRGLIQPKTAREIASLSQGGVEIGDYTIFLLPRTLDGSAYIRDDPEGLRRFDVTGVRSFEFGRSPHLEVDARLVVLTQETVVGS